MTSPLSDKNVTNVTIVTILFPTWCGLAKCMSLEQYFLPSSSLRSTSTVREESGGGRSDRWHHIAGWSGVGATTDASIHSKLWRSATESEERPCRTTTPKPEQRSHSQTGASPPAQCMCDSSPKLCSRTVSLPYVSQSR